MSANEPGKWKRYKEGQNMIDNYLRLGTKSINKYNTNGTFFQSARNAMRAARNYLLGGSQSDTLATKMESYADGTKIPGFGGVVNALAKPVRGFGSMIDKIAGIPGSIYSLMKDKKTGILFKFKPDVNSEGAMNCFFQSSIGTYKVTFGNNDGLGISLKFKPGVDSCQDVTNQGNYSSLLGDNCKAIIVPTKVESIRFKCMGKLKLIDLVEKWDRDLKAGILQLMFKNHPSWNVDIYFPKNKLTVKIFEHKRGVDDEWVVNLRRSKSKKKSVKFIE